MIGSYLHPRQYLLPAPPDRTMNQIVCTCGEVRMESQIRYCGICKDVTCLCCLTECASCHVAMCVHCADKQKYYLKCDSCYTAEDVIRSKALKIRHCFLVVNDKQYPVTQNYEELINAADWDLNDRPVRYLAIKGLGVIKYEYKSIIPVEGTMEKDYFFYGHLEKGFRYENGELKKV